MAKKLIIGIVYVIWSIGLWGIMYDPGTPSTVFFILWSVIFLLLNYDIRQKKHSLWRNYPIIGRLRWVFESQRDKIRQYFNESDTDGKPFSKEQRSIVYQRSKGELETVPFGTKHDVTEVGHEYVEHTHNPKEVLTNRIMIGANTCPNPYSSSIMNISAMSYGSLSGAAVRALNKGAKLGMFYQNTGEGGISTHHEQGGDLVFQFGTGYFGCGETVNYTRVFNEQRFLASVMKDQVKMIEIKRSQGAKPGHGGMLPAKKNTVEIAKIRCVEPHIAIDSPPHHSAFSNDVEMCAFIQRLRTLTGKPVGIKMCIGSRKEFSKMVKTFRKEGIWPDFISIDGSEGGTGSAPLEFTNSVGTPLAEALVFTNEVLKKNKLREDVKIIASGKIIDVFDIYRAMALGADAVNVARGFMFSLGCIQAVECNKDTCPVGIATQNKSLEKGLVVEEKWERVYNYQFNTVRKFLDFVGVTGLSSISDIKPTMVYRRTNKGFVTLKEYYSITS
jgi:glutamate synthase domain-containing protein 2